MEFHPEGISVGGMIVISLLPAGLFLFLLLFFSMVRYSIKTWKKRLELIPSRSSPCGKLIRKMPVLIFQPDLNLSGLSKECKDCSVGNCPYRDAEEDTLERFIT